MLFGLLTAKEKSLWNGTILVKLCPESLPKNGPVDTWTHTDE